MRKLKNRKLSIFLIFLIFVVSFSISTTFAEDLNETNITKNDFEISEIERCDNSNCDLTLNDNTGVVSSHNPKPKTIFLVSDSPGTNILDAASRELIDSGLNNVNLIVRSGNQVKTMSECELYGLVNQSDAFIGEWVSTDVDSVLTSLLVKYPNLSKKELFLILEPPSGKISSTSTSIGLIRNNTIANVRIFDGFTNNELINYFTITKRGNSYDLIYDFLTNGDGVRFNPKIGRAHV